MRRISLATVITILLIMTKAHAAPTHINNQEQAKGNEMAMTQNVTSESQTVQAELTTKQDEVSPQPQIEPVKSEIEEVPPINNDPKSQAKATLIDLGHGDAWYAVEYIGFKESSWNPHAINNIGACGLFQALPCSKMNCELSDVPCQVRWATNYAVQRYGSWQQAHNFWVANNWW